MTLSLTSWLWFTGILFLEATLIFLMATAAVFLRKKSARWKRLIWQAALVAMIAVLGAELAGLPARWQSRPRPALIARVNLFSMPAERSSGPATAPRAVPIAPLVEPAVPELHEVVFRWPLWIWLGGFILLFGCQGASVVLFARFRGKNRSAICPAISKTALAITRQLGFRRSVQFQEDSRIVSPISCGIFQSRILLPVAFAEQFSEQEQAVILAHELTHAAGRDPAWRALSDFAAALWWWHPLVWLARREWQNASEAAADESSALFPDGPRILAECLVKLARQLANEPHPIGSALRGNGFRSNLGRRVSRLLEISDHKWSPQNPIASIFGRAAAIILLLALAWGSTLWAQRPVSAPALPALPPTVEVLNPIAPEIRVVTAPEISSDSGAPTQELPATTVFFASTKDTVGTPPAAAAEPAPASLPANQVPSQEPETLHTRTYKLDAQALAAGLAGIKNASGLALPPETATEGEKVREQLKALIAAAGISLVPPRSAFYNDRTGVLMMRGSEKDLDAIENVVALLNTVPPQITFDVRLVEIPEDPSGGARFLRALSAGNGSLSGSENSDASFRAILPPAEWRDLLKKLEKNGSATILAAPRLTTLSGRTGIIKIAESLSVVKGLTASTNPGVAFNYTVEPVEVGPSVEITPTVLADGVAIRLQATPRLVQFAGYSKGEEAKLQNSTATVPKPNFRIREMTTTMDVRDGYTLAMGGLVSEGSVKFRGKVPILGDLPFVGRFFRHEGSGTVRKTLLIFITPRIIDPAGQPVHPEEPVTR
jgi:beta-lactamase regulating signal transducer with metallopeptidase domain